MRRWLGQARLLVPVLVERSPLRRVDPRAKLALSVCVSLAVMLPVERLALFMALYVLLLWSTRLLVPAARQVWRLRWVLAILLVVDWVIVGPELAIAVALRVILLACVFTLFVGTTTPGELRLALEKLRVPYRYAFSLSLAFQSVGLLGDEWQAIREAQGARGALPEVRGLRAIVVSLRDWVALTVPAIVLTTRRAWAITEAASARGFGAPHRRPYYEIRMGWRDWALTALAVAIVAAFIVC
ncbi:MAG: energy-coupling factor transporter transmembrane protein EcfT [Anaerolineae bacterium]|nr:energy-coupling factor transporter transmembrane protein EcfT [Anaerolineae bacterium]